MSDRYRPWRRPASREARNEHRKMLGAIFNAVAIALVVTAFVGPEINPALAGMTGFERGRLVMFGACAHLLARYFVRDMEDR